MVGEDGGDKGLEAEVARGRLTLYVESLRLRMPKEQFDLLMRVIVQGADGGTVRISGPDKDLFTPEVQQEFFNLQALLGSLAAGHEDRADYVVVQLEDTQHVRGASTLVSRKDAADPEKLREIRERLAVQQRQRTSDRLAVEEIARVSGMDATASDGEA